MIDINLAPIRYRDIHRSAGGPIESLSARPKAVLGSPGFEAFATLNHEATGVERPRYEIYGNCHGTGTDARRSSAVYKAISEALERWAWSACSQSALAEKLGFGVDSTSTGFAAFPSWFASSARKRAFSEAVERWSVAAWWEGKLRHSPLPSSASPLSGIRILSPWPNEYPVVLWDSSSNDTCYGFACSSSLRSSILKAEIELSRNRDVLAYFRGLAEKPKLGASLERRLLYFASNQGFESFLKRVGESDVKSSAAPALLVDTRVEGPWTKYAHVWRCLFDNFQLSEQKGDDYFLF